MNRLSKTKIIAIITTLIVLSLIVSITLSLTMCKYWDYDAPEQVQSPYGNFDYSKKPYFSIHLLSGMVCYQNKMYYLNSSGELGYLSLTELEKDMTTYVRKDPSEYVGLTEYNVCPVAEHKHNTLGISDDCPGVVGISKLFVLDAYESGGSYPVIYYPYTRLLDLDDAPWDRQEPYVLYRYDTGSNTREALAEFTNAPIQMMSYGDYLYIVMQSAENSYELYEIHKSTKKVHTRTIGSGRLEFVDADEDYVYVSDWLGGTLYRMDHELQNSELIFTQPEVITVSDADQTLGIFLHDGYIYYRSDYENVPMQINDTQSIEPFRYNIRRVPMTDPQGDGELVAEGVFELCDFGVAGNKFYFTPMDYGDTIKDCYFNFSSGRLCVVDLSTLECTDLVSDSGLLFDREPEGILTERYIVTNIRPIAQTGYDLTTNDGAVYYTLYDFETGSLYHMYATMSVTVKT